MANILIIYSYKNYPPRVTHLDHLYSFQRYSPHRCYYLNIWGRAVPRYLTRMEFDLVLFHYTFFDLRYIHDSFRKLIAGFAFLRRSSAVKGVLLQDEYTSTDILCDFINQVGIDLVFSVAPAGEWPRIYDKVDFAKVRFHRVLTGYLADHTVARINRLAQARPGRDLDIGYRVRFAPFLGRFGLLKVRLAEEFQAKAPGWGLALDISSRDEDAFWGDSWFEFLLRCKYTLGVEGGASLLDRSGQILQASLEYSARHPQAAYDEIEARCFPGADGSLKLAAISPRHLEACASRTCQVLIEGEYNSILAPGRHYLELKKDFSNIDQILAIIKQDNMRQEITDRAYRDIVASGRYTYRHFVSQVLGASLPEGLQAKDTPGHRVLYRWMQWADRLSWLKVALYRAALRAVPPRLLAHLRQRKSTN